jgi:transposase
MHDPKSHETVAGTEPRFAAFAAIDWADQKHVWSLQPADSEQRQHGEIAHTPEDVESWVTTLLTRFNGQPLAVAVEQSRGALVFMLSKYEQLHLYPINPRAAAQLRAALYPSGAKDDPADAELLLDLLVHHRTHLRRLQPETEQTRLIQHLVEGRRKLVNEKTRQSNRLTARLKLYFPQVLHWFAAVDSPVVGALLERWPTLEELQKAHPATLRSFLRTHHYGQEQIDRRLEQIRQALPAVRDAAVIRSSVAMSATLVHFIAVLREGVKELDRQIEQAVAAHPDQALWNSFPGAGRVLAPRLLAAFGSQRDRYRTAAEIQQYSGIAPVMEQSGKAKWVHFRWACPKFLRQTFQEWAHHSIGFCDWARAYYQQQIAAGHDHQAAVRALAFKWIRIAFRCWKDGVAYEDSRYVESLRRRGSPLAQTINRF